MTKQNAIDIFGSASKLAKALGITRQAVSQWDDNLSLRRIDEVTGAAYRLGRLPRILNWTKAE